MLFHFHIFFWVLRAEFLSLLVQSFVGNVVVTCYMVCCFQIAPSQPPPTRSTNNKLNMCTAAHPSFTDEYMCMIIIETFVFIQCSTYKYNVLLCSVPLYSFYNPFYIYSRLYQLTNNKIIIFKYIISPRVDHILSRQVLGVAIQLRSYRQKCVILHDIIYFFLLAGALMKSRKIL